MASSATANPLFITADPGTAATLHRLATAAAVTAVTVADAAAARRHWAAAGQVVIGPDAVGDCLAARLPPRDGVILLTDDRLPPDRAWQAASRLGARQVVDAASGGAWLARRLAAAPCGRDPSPIVMVIGACGGVGASTLACALGLAAARHGRSALLVDTDEHGGGLDLALGWECDIGQRWPQLLRPGADLDPAGLRSRLPGREHLSMITIDRRMPVRLTLDQVAPLVAAARDGFDVVVVDLPRTGADWHTDLALLGDTVLMVVPADLRGIAAARLLLARHDRVRPRVRLIVREPAGVALTATDVAEALETRVMATVSTETAVDPAAGPADCRPGLATGADRLLSALLAAEESS